MGGPRLGEGTEHLWGALQSRWWGQHPCRSSSIEGLETSRHQSEALDCGGKGGA